MRKIKIFTSNGKKYIKTEIGIYNIDYLRINEKDDDSDIYIDLFDYLFWRKIEIDNSYSDRARTIFINGVKDAYYHKHKEMFIYYFDKFELNNSLLVLSFLLDCYEPDFEILNRLKMSISKLSYSDFLSLLKRNMNNIDSLSKLLKYANESYVNQEETLTFISKTNFSFLELGFFKKFDLLTNKNNIKSCFSFIG